MAIKVPIVSDFDDKGIKGATAGFAKLKADVAAANGVMGKFSAATSGAFGMLKANAVAGAAAAGAAIAVFAAKSVMAFQDLALASGKFADSTGLSVEQASRFIEVAGDLGIQTGTIEGAFNKLNRAVASGSGAFQDIGAEIARTSSGAVDVQQTFLNVVDALNKIKDPAARAKAATELLGKGWTEMSELIAGGSASLVASLKSVSDAKVVDEEELAKAKRFRDSLDDLKGVGEDLALSLGEALVPALSDLAEVLVAGVEGLKTIHGWLKINESDFTDEIALVNKLKAEQEFLNNAWREGYRAQIDAANASQKLTTYLDDQANAVARASAEWDSFKSSLEFQNEFDQLQKSTSEFAEGWAKAVADGVSNSAEWQAALRNNQLALLNFADEILTTASVADRTRIRIGIETGEIMSAIDLMNTLLGQFASFAMEAGTLYGTVGGYGGVPLTQGTGVWIDGQYLAPGTDFSGFMADGGVVSGPTLAVIGEAGPEAVIPLDRLSDFGSGGITVNVAGSVVTQNDLIEAIRRGLANSQRNGNQLVYNL